MNKLLDQTRIGNFYKKLIEIPEFINELNDFAKKEVLKYAETEQLKALKLLNEIIIANPKQTFKASQIDNYNDAKFVIDLIKESRIIKSTKSKKINQFFKSYLSNDQIKYLFKEFERYEFIELDSKDSFINFFNAEHKSNNEIQWNINNGIIAYLFDELMKNRLISNYWQDEIDKKACFKNKNGKTLLKGDLSVALFHLNKSGIPEEPKEIIDKILKNILKNH